MLIKKPKNGSEKERLDRSLCVCVCVCVCVRACACVHQNLLLLSPTERFLTEQSLNHHAFQSQRPAERPAPSTPTPARSSKRKPHHGDNSTPSRWPRALQPPQTQHCILHLSQCYDVVSAVLLCYHQT